MISENETRKREAFECELSHALRSGDPKLFSKLLDPASAAYLEPRGYILNPFIDLLYRKAYEFEYEPAVECSDLPARCLYVLRVKVKNGRKWGHYCVGDLVGCRRVLFCPQPTDHA